MKVGIIVDVEPGIHGGIATALRSLITALGQLEGPETYVLIVENQTQVDWLSPLAANQRFEMRPASSGNPVRDLLRSVKGMANKALGRDGRVGWPQVPISDGWLESLGSTCCTSPHRASPIAPSRRSITPTICSTCTTHNSSTSQTSHGAKRSTVRLAGHPTRSL